MIVRSLCNKCFQPYKILVQASDVELVKEVSTNEGRNCPCPRLCGGEINLVGDAAVQDGVQLREPVELTGLMLYQSVNGLGLPDEIPKDREVLESLLKANRVSSVNIEEVGGSFYMHSIGLENGVTVFLSTGARGARVLKITKERTNGPVDHS